MHLHLGALVALVVLCSSVSTLSLGRVYWNFPNPQSPYSLFNPHPSTNNYPLHLHFPIPDGTPVDQLYVYIRAQGDWNGYYDNLRFYFNTISGAYDFIIMDNHWYDGQTINGNFINPDPFGNVYECYLPYDGVAVNNIPYPGPSCAGGIIKVFDDGLQSPYYNYGGSQYQFPRHFYSAFSTQGIFPQGLTDNILLGYPGTTISNNKIYGGVVDFTAYFNGVGSNYYFFMAVGLGAAGFGGDPHLTTVFGDTIDFGEGIWSIAQKEHFAVNAKVANFYTREVAVISSDSQYPFALHIITNEDSSVTVLLNDEEIALNSIHLDGRLRYSEDILNVKQVAGALTRYWLSEIVVRLGAEVLTFHIADHPTAGTLIEMIYEEIFTGDANLQVRDADEPSGLLFMPSAELHERSMANLERYRLFELM